MNSRRAIVLIKGEKLTGGLLRLENTTVVGRKAVGIARFPSAWRPPFAVLSTETFSNWQSADREARDVLLRMSGEAIVAAARSWQTKWSKGIILRSSASSETLNDRGVHTSYKLAADFGIDSITDTLSEMFINFTDTSDNASLAIIVQPLIEHIRLGHLSNERRVSMTINHWQWEQDDLSSQPARFNSQRHRSPDENLALDATTKNELLTQLKCVGAWAVSLGYGRTHLEWAQDKERLWLLQLDFENDSPDDGVDPSKLHRDEDLRPANEPPVDSSIKLVKFSEETIKWRKIENTRIFAAVRTDPFPKLFYIKGSILLEGIHKNLDLASHLEAIAHGRVVCRTDCISTRVEKVNLPRTHTVSSVEAISSMKNFLSSLMEKGVTPEDVCFVIHKFIPATVGAWVRADPSSQIVKVDSLWGVPDGLQYLPHDTFEYDVRNHAETGVKLRYKPRFIQECESGEWRELRIHRSRSRRRSLSVRDVREIATASHSIATQLGKQLLIMWFCGIPDALGIGRNLPWFRMNVQEIPLLAGESVAPRWPRQRVRNLVDLEEVAASGRTKITLLLDPEVEFIRDDARFLLRAIEIAQSLRLAIELAGSALSHAYYQLERSGVPVSLADQPGWSRVRRRQDFGKLVRDNIPQRIERGGEVVLRAQLSRSELRRALVAKLFEEGQELLGARDPDQVKGELADILEVVRSLASVTGVKLSEIEEVADEKQNERGGFVTGTVLLETSLPAPGRPVRRGSPPVTLRKMGRVVTGVDAASISFNALVAAGKDGAEAKLSSRRIAVSLSRDGIEIRFKPQDESPGERSISAQLLLPFDG